MGFSQCSGHFLPRALEPRPRFPVGWEPFEQVCWLLTLCLMSTLLSFGVVIQYFPLGNPPIPLDKAAWDLD